MGMDKLGRPATSINCGREDFTPVAWDDTTTQGVLYLRGDYSDECIIARIDEINETVTWTRGAWANRASLEYGTDRLINR